MLYVGKTATNHFTAGGLAILNTWPRCARGFVFLNLNQGLLGHGPRARAIGDTIDVQVSESERVTDTNRNCRTARERAFGSGHHRGEPFWWAQHDSVRPAGCSRGALESLDTI